jgi:hypothetical protein
MFSPQKIRENLLALNKQIVDRVKKNGNTFITVGDDEHGSGFVYSIGSVETYHQPDIISFGLYPEYAHQFIDEITDSLTNGEIKVGEKIDGLAEKGYSMYLLPIDKSVAEKYMVKASVYYEENTDLELKAVQLVFQDEGYRFPWEEGSEETYEEANLLITDSEFRQMCLDDKESKKKGK